jgi:hypothetical protein
VDAEELQAIATELGKPMSGAARPSHDGIIVSHYRSSTSYQICFFNIFDVSISETTMRPSPVPAPRMIVPVAPGPTH